MLRLQSFQSSQPYSVLVSKSVSYADPLEVKMSEQNSDDSRVEALCRSLGSLWSDDDVIDVQQGISRLNQDFSLSPSNLKLKNRGC